MLKLTRILVTAHALVAGAAVLTACGQRGPLVLPNTPASAGRATLPEALNPFHPSPIEPQPATKTRPDPTRVP
ncbi:hypothetical protein B9Z47_03115 [Limnohabitans sp. 2KL-1]|uniref:LPS translocon maturation chaperone LptM n=1 Tax=Limnohabitans sp. 2KL-1 TaxID=1100699 RepID=UPI000D38A10E|nr:hypothetical protein B9Z47_03115 [Limnohabitans sp. 2KL-1]